MWSAFEPIRILGAIEIFCYCFKLLFNLFLDLKSKRDFEKNLSEGFALYCNRMDYEKTNPSRDSWQAIPIRGFPSLWGRFSARKNNSAGFFGFSVNLHVNTFSYRHSHSIGHFSSSNFKKICLACLLPFSNIPQAMCHFGKLSSTSIPLKPSIIMR